MVGREIQQADCLLNRIRGGDSVAESLLCAFDFKKRLEHPFLSHLYQKQGWDLIYELAVSSEGVATEFSPARCQERGKKQAFKAKVATLEIYSRGRILEQKRPKPQITRPLAEPQEGGSSTTDRILQFSDFEFTLEADDEIVFRHPRGAGDDESGRKIEDLFDAALVSPVLDHRRIPQIKVIIPKFQLLRINDCAVWNGGISAFFKALHRKLLLLSGSGHFQIFINCLSDTNSEFGSVCPLPWFPAFPPLRLHFGDFSPNQFSLPELPGIRNTGVADKFFGIDPAMGEQQIMEARSPVLWNFETVELNSRLLDSREDFLMISGARGHEILLVDFSEYLTHLAGIKHNIHSLDDLLLFLEVVSGAVKSVFERLLCELIGQVLAIATKYDLSWVFIGGTTICLHINEELSVDVGEVLRDSISTTDWTDFGIKGTRTAECLSIARVASKASVFLSMYGQIFYSVGGLEEGNNIEELQNWMDLIRVLLGFSKSECKVFEVEALVAKILFKNRKKYSFWLIPKRVRKYFSDVPWLFSGHSYYYDGCLLTPEGMLPWRKECGGAILDFRRYTHEINIWFQQILFRGIEGYQVLLPMIPVLSLS